MEEFSRRVLAALLVALAGPGAAMLTLLLIGPTLIWAAVPEAGGGLVETGVGVLMGLLMGAVLTVGAAYVVAAAATLFALRATKCPRPQFAWLMCLAVSPMWMAALSRLDLGLTSLVVLFGVGPGVVRLGFGFLGRSGSHAGGSVPPSAEIR